MQILSKPSPCRRAIAFFLALLASGCQVQLVSPYSADLQKRATDMLADVVGWDGRMRNVAGTAAADPRHPDVQAKLQMWRGDIAVMGAIELSIDPGSTSCDKFLAAISGRISDELKKSLPVESAIAGSTAKPMTHCETLPGIFSRMAKQVSGGAADHAGIPFILNQQCKLPWLPDGYFAALGEARATMGALSPARPASASARPGTPTPAEENDAVTRCRSLFEPPSGAVHGVLVDQLVVDLDAIIYREGRQAPTSAK